MSAKKPFFLAIALLGIVILAATSAQATIFNVPAGPNLDGQSYNGFTFHGAWMRYAFDDHTAPFTYRGSGEWQPHSLTYDAGVFTFENMWLNGRPYDGYTWTPNGGALSFVFKDSSGSVIGGTYYISVPGDDSWLNLSFSSLGLSAPIQGVHEIYFNTNYFYCRLGGINATAIPIPGALWLLGSGLLGLIGLKRKFLG
jgi:hypothetical protein